MTAELVSFALFAMLLIIGGLTDIRFRVIPNWVCLLIVALGFTKHFAESGFSGLSLAAVGLALPLLLFVPLYALKIMGAGDVKFVAAAGSFIGLGELGNLIVLIVLLGGVLGVFQVVVNRAPTFAPFLARYYYPDTNSKGFVPYGVAIAAGGILCPFISVVALPV